VGEVTEGDRSGGAHVLIRELVNHLVELIDWNLSLVLENMIMNWTSSALNGGVSIEIEVILEGMSDIVLNQGSWNRVVVAVSGHSIAFLGEEANVMTFGANSDSPSDLSWCE
jgi:hypothetical protein